MPRRRLLAVLALLALASSSPAGEPAKDLKDPDATVRLAAVDALWATPGADAEALLVSALSDKDGEVAERAAKGLATRPGEAGARALADLAMKGWARRIRASAARALAAHADWKAGADVLTKAAGQDLGEACRAAAILGDTHTDEVLEKLLERGLSSKKDLAVKAAAARGLGAFPAAERIKRTESLVGAYLASRDRNDDNGHVADAAANALEALRYKPDPETMPVLLTLLAKPGLTPTIDRRVRAAIVSIVAKRAKGDEALGVAKKAFDLFGSGLTPESSVRIVRLVGEVAEIPDDHVARDALLAALKPAFDHSDAKVRSAAAWSLQRIGSDAAVEKAIAMARNDADPHVRLIAVLTVAALRDPVKDDASRGLFCDRLTYDENPLVREESAVALGRKGGRGADKELRAAVDRAMNDKKGTEWAVGTCALVSLGKTRDPANVSFMAGVYEKAKDWRLRGAAVVGLGHVRDKAAVATLVSALGAKEAAVRASAFEFLRRMTNEQISRKQADWAAWWAKNEKSYVFVDREEEIRKAQKYGYAPDIPGVYEGLDVICFESRGDHIQDLLKDLKIEHRTVRSGQIGECGLHPFAIYVANCTGEIQEKDVEPLQWFVRTGGYLFSSCWALKFTVEKVYPDVLKKYEHKQEVLDNVDSTQLRIGSPFLEGVSPDLVVPKYVLYGAFLVETVDADRLEVLIDNPWTEGKYGSGELAAWCRGGHGLLLDSVNHFEKQGFERAAGLKTATDRMAYAVDHLGITYPEMRKIPAAAWNSSQESAKAASDLSSFRFLTNFVRQKRKSQE